MFRYTLPDGTLIEATFSGFPNGPSQLSGQCYGTSFMWIRINNGEWQKTNKRNRINLTRWLEICNNLQDFLESEKD